MPRSIGFFCQVLVFLAMAPCSVIALPDGVLLGQRFGGPHGGDFSDIAMVSSGQNVLSVTVSSGARVNSISIAVNSSSGMVSTMSHGGGGGEQRVLQLANGEYITGVEAHMGKKDGRTRIQYISFVTNLHNLLTGGTQTKDMDKDHAPDGYQLGGFFGASGHELDALGAIWTSLPSSGSDGNAPVRSSMPSMGVV